MGFCLSQKIWKSFLVYPFIEFSMDLALKQFFMCQETPYVRPIYVLCLRGNNLINNKCNFYLFENEAHVFLEAYLI